MEKSLRTYKFISLILLIFNTISLVLELNGVSPLKGQILTDFDFALSEDIESLSPQRDLEIFTGYHRSES
ncbi:hypothetical protein HZH66_006244 [Vespula vulgaris]|uniref:Uncharacterized protein n=1 Tax=Vespula vulgaris TaxID=7454 RepID=A0A834K1J0_VESVU|nr:hypothetical protein HZH66_006244 [Vespula vulgaris]